MAYTSVLLGSIFLSPTVHMNQGGLIYSEKEYRQRFQDAKAKVETVVGKKLTSTLVFSNKRNDKPTETDGVALDRPSDCQAAFAFFLPEQRQIGFRNLLFEAHYRSRVDRFEDLLDLATVSFLHELLHDFQYEIIKEKKPGLRTKWIRFCCEGHAEFFSAAIARSLGITEKVLSLTSPQQPPRLSCNPETDRLLIRRYFYYALSREFVSKNGPQVTDFPSLLQKCYSYRDLIGCSLKDGDSSKVAIPRLKDLCRQVANLRLSEAQELDFFELSTLVCPAVYDSRELCTGYRGGLLVPVRHDDGMDADFLLLEHEKGFGAAFLASLAKYAQKGRAVLEQRETKTEPIRLSRYPAEDQECLLLQVDERTTAIVVRNIRSSPAMAKKLFDSLKKAE